MRCGSITLPGITASKNADSAEVTRLKKIVEDLKAGGTGEVDEDGPTAGAGE